MSALLAVVQTVASASPSVSPSPVVHTVAQAVAPHVNSISDTLNELAGRVSVADLMAAAGAIVVGAQYLINQFPFVRDLEDRAAKTFNWVVSFLLPFLTAVLASVVSGNNTLNLAPYIYVAAQLLYFIVEYIKSKATAPAPVVTETAQQF